MDEKNIFFKIFQFLFSTIVHSQNTCMIDVIMTKTKNNVTKGVFYLFLEINPTYTRVQILSI